MCVTVYLPLLLHTILFIYCPIAHSHRHGHRVHKMPSVPSLSMYIFASLMFALPSNPFIKVAYKFTVACLTIWFFSFSSKSLPFHVVELVIFVQMKFYGQQNMQFCVYSPQPQHFIFLLLSDFVRTEIKCLFNGARFV